MATELSVALIRRLARLRAAGTRAPWAERAHDWGMRYLRLEQERLARALALTTFDWLRPGLEARLDAIATVLPPPPPDPTMADLLRGMRDAHHQASTEAETRLRQGPEAFNAWRREDRFRPLLLRDLDLAGVDLTGVDWRDCVLIGLRVAEAVLPPHPFEGAVCHGLDVRVVPFERPTDEPALVLRVVSPPLWAAPGHLVGEVLVWNGTHAAQEVLIRVTDGAIEETAASQSLAPRERQRLRLEIVGSGLAADAALELRLETAVDQQHSPQGV